MSAMGWDKCLERYEQLKQRPQWEQLADAMIRLIHRIREDRAFPATTQVISHAWLRIGPRVDDPKYQPSVWVGWRRPRYYWIGVGSFGTRNRVTVSADKVVPMLRRYLDNIKHLDPSIARFIEDNEEIAMAEPDPIQVDPWTQAELMEKYAGLLKDEVVDRFTADVTVQAEDIRTFVEQLHEAMADMQQVDGLRDAADEILIRLDRIHRVIEQGLATYRSTPEPHKLFSSNGHHHANPQQIDES